MREVRQGGEGRINHLNLGPLHVKVKEFCKSIIENPDLLLMGSEGSYKQGALDHQPWDRPDVVYVVQALSGSLPDLKGCLVAFFKGALETWEHLISEFTEGGVISELRPEEKNRIFINATNDHNEGALGTTRLTLRKAGNTSVTTISAKMMYARNDPETFIQDKLPGMTHWKFVMNEVRTKGAQKINKRK